jgi:hypothetical protein
MKPFKIPENIYFFPVDYNTGEITSFSEAKAISEPFKENSLKEINLKNLGLGKKYDKFKKFRKFY